ncbi:MAG: tRNA (guanosine(37)-N1)-methyltransferase TrmD [Myxococcota bacterium]|nr:tRNA (guanosine(37)-N1)-methyltransferase TrmD [Myxococcota bacterium]
MSYTVQVITLVPGMWATLLGPESGLVGKAFERGVADLHLHDLRDYGKGVHRKVDDAPYGGGAGMVLQVEPLHDAIKASRALGKGPVVLLSPRGKPFTQEVAQELAQGEGMTLICGRYEGVDERIREHIDLELSVGDMVLSAGDPAAWCMIDAAVRLLPGVLGNPGSLQEESFSSGLLEYPQYSRPASWEGREVPPVLLSGDHGAIERWRAEESLALTREHRPDLLGRGPRKSES